VILSAWDVIPFCESTEAAESIACLKGVNQALMTVHTGISIESDCASLIKKLSSSEKDRSRTASIVLDIKLILEKLPDFKLKKIRRESWLMN
jgi:hypothetical protein